MPMLRFAVASLIVSAASGLRVQPHVAHVAHARMVQPRMVASPPASAVSVERYVATNRFRVKDGREAVFEKRWADRKSRLGLLGGFRFFCMLRRVAAEPSKPHADDINCASSMRAQHARSPVKR